MKVPHRRSRHRYIRRAPHDHWDEARWVVRVQINLIRWLNVATKHERVTAWSRTLESRRYKVRTASRAARALPPLRGQLDGNVPPAYSTFIRLEGRDAETRCRQHARLDPDGYQDLIQAPEAEREEVHHQRRVRAITRLGSPRPIGP
jgi:hypothetical protein